MGSNFFDFHEKVAAGKTRKTPASDEGAMTVAQLTGVIERSIRAGVPASVRVQGEASNLNHHRASGHLYFTLKDASACIDCVMFKSDMARVKFQPADGMQLLVIGRVSVYAQRGRYQLYVSTLHPLGAGALEIAFRQMRAKLEKEGLFSRERKKPIPAYPARIVLITSRQTAALQDMLKVLRRFSWIRLFVYHVPVQGEGCAEKIAAAIRHVAAKHASIGGADVILLGRGGGSLEDLWGFNEEVVARAMAECPIPIVSGIGHEVDTSIADLVADHHAHTPTEAAQVVTAQWRVARDAVAMSSRRLSRAMRGVAQAAATRLTGIERHEVFRRPMDIVNTRRQRIDDRELSLTASINERLHTLHRRLGDAEARLEAHRPSAVVARMRQHLALRERNLFEAITGTLRGCHDRLANLRAMLRERHPRHAAKLESTRVAGLALRLRRAMEHEIARRHARIDALASHLNAVGPEQVLRRGYSMTMRKKDGTVIRHAAQIKPGERLLTRLADGRIESIADDPSQPPLFE